MFSRLCGTVYSVNNLEFRLWAPFNTGGEMQFDPMCYTLLHKVTKTYIFQKIICLLLHLYVKFWTNFAIHSYAFKCSSNRMKHLYHTCYQFYFTVPCLYSLLFYFVLFIYFFFGGGVKLCLFNCDVQLYSKNIVRICLLLHDKKAEV